jgi:serine/threonine-protein phosphatase 2A regulatory subunit B'
VPPSKRQELFVRKLVQCQVLFDFNDPSSDLRNKDIKRQELQEMLEYVGTSRGAITDMIYPDVIRMVRLYIMRIQET